MRSIEKLIAPLYVLIFPKIFNYFSYHSTFRMPKYEPGPYILIYAKQVELFTKFSMVTFLCFFQKIQIFFKLFLCSKCSTIYSLQHLIFFITTPIGACNRKKFKIPKISCGRDMRSPTKVSKIPLRKHTHSVIGNFAKYF